MNEKDARYGTFFEKTNNLKGIFLFSSLGFELKT